MKLIGLLLSNYYFIQYVISSSSSTMKLIQVSVVSRHGIRTPYAPDNGTVTDFTSYTQKIFPDNTSWGMTFEAFADQHLTPHGEKILPYMGSYYAEKYMNDSLDLTSCNNIITFADDSSRDIITAGLWLQGFGCPNIPVNVVNSTDNPDMQPILSDHYYSGCPVATEEQVNGLYGGNVNALTDMYFEEIQAVINILEMPPNAYICQYANPNFDPKTENCTLFETGYTWTGLYYQGMFKSPLYYAQYFAEAWMFQYLSNLTDWGFNLITYNQLGNLYQMHIETLWFGTNYWNALAYSSQQLGYILATMEQYITKKHIKGISKLQSVDTQLLLLVSHDTNILYLQRLLDLNWIPMGFSNRIATTGGTLSFELWQDEDNQYYVKVHYDAAKPDQQRNAEILSLDNPPAVSELIIPECGELYCPYDTFKSIVLDIISTQCIEEPLKSSIESMKSNKNNSDNSKHWKYWELVLLTAGICVIIFGIINSVVYFLFQKNKKDGDFLIHGDNKH